MTDSNPRRLLNRLWRRIRDACRERADITEAGGNTSDREIDEYRYWTGDNPITVSGVTKKCNSFSVKQTRRKLLSLAGGTGLLGVVPTSALGGKEENEPRNGQKREGSQVTAQGFDYDLAANISTDEFQAMIVETEYRGVAEQSASFEQELQEFPRQDGVYTVLSTGDATEAPNDPDVFASTWWENERFIPGYSPDGFDAHCVVDLEITFEVPEDAEGIAFDYQFGTEESPSFLGSMYQDFFEAQLFSPDGEVSNIALINTEPVTVDVADTVANTPGGSSEDPSPPLPDPPDVAYNAVTDLQEVEQSVAQYQGEEITLRFRLGDASDGFYDSAVFLDHLRFVSDVETDPGLERAEQAFEDAEEAYNELLDSYIRGEAHFTAIVYEELGNEFLDVLVDYWGIRAGTVPDDKLDEQTIEALNTVIEAHNEGNEIEFTQARASSLYTFYDELADALTEEMSLSSIKETTYNYLIGEGDGQNEFLDFGNGDSFSDVVGADFGITAELFSKLQAEDLTAKQVEATTDAFEDLATQYRSRAEEIVRSKEVHAEQLTTYEGEDTLEIHLQQTTGEVTSQVDSDIEPQISGVGLAIAVVTVVGTFAVGGAAGYVATRCSGSYAAAKAIDGVDATGVSVSGPGRWGTQQVATVSNMLTVIGTYLPETGEKEVEPQDLSFASGFLTGASVAGKELMLDYLKLVLEAALAQEADATAALDMAAAEEQKTGGLLKGIVEYICDAPVIGWFCSYERPSVMVSEGELVIENTGQIAWTPKLSSDYRLFAGGQEFPAGYGVEIEGDTDTTLFDGESKTYSVTARAPTGEGLTSGRIDIGLGVNPAGEQFPSGWTDVVPIGLCETDYYALREASTASVFELNENVDIETVVADSVVEGESVESDLLIADKGTETLIELTYPDQGHYANLQVRDSEGNLTGYDPTQPDGEPQESEEIPFSEYSGLDTGKTEREWVRIIDPSDEGFELDIEVVAPEIGTLDSNTIAGQNAETQQLSVDFNVNSTVVPELAPRLSTSDEVIVDNVYPGEKVTAVVSISEINGDNALGTVTCSVTEFKNGAGETFEATLDETEFTLGEGEKETVGVTGTVPEDLTDDTFTTEMSVISEKGGNTSTNIEVIVPLVAGYANEQDIVDIDGLRSAIEDWRSGDIETDMLSDVIDAWRSGDPVT